MLVKMVTAIAIGGATPSRRSASSRLRLTMKTGISRQSGEVVLAGLAGSQLAEGIAALSG
jgi:hypothetical protein